VKFHIVDHVWRHDGDSISESALVLGDLVFSVKGNFAWWIIWLRGREVTRSEL
jgi:hypothetical protein